MYILSFGILGALLGSFTTLLIHRLHFEEKGIFWGRSKCPKCAKTLSVKNLIPIFSWLLQGGKCAYCKHKIPFFYPLVELSFISSFALFAWYFPDIQTSWPYFVALLFTLILFWYDVKYFEVDRRISFPAIILALVWAFFRPESWELFLIGGGVGAFFYFVQYFYSKRRWVGAGDIELGAFMGLLLGWKIFLLSLFAAYIFGSLITIPVLLFSKKFGWKSKVPMGAFLMPSLILFLLMGEKIWDWYMGTMF
jgi:prepilin signal peptidase PulO-like enzyme (type II secretory pathway)